MSQNFNSPDPQNGTLTPQTVQPKKPHSAWLRWFGTILSIGLLIYLLSQQGWHDIAYAASQIAWWRFFLAIFLVFVSRFAVVGRWHVLMSSAGTGITLRQSARLTFAMLFASNFLPTTIGGDVFRLAGAIRLGFDQAISVASLVVDRLVGMTGMAMAFILSLPIFLHAFNGSPAPLGMAFPFISSLANKFLNFLSELKHSMMTWLRTPRSLLYALGFTWIHMLCTFATVWVLLRGMGETISFWSVMGLWSATYFVTLLPISINGMGVQELAVTYFYVTIGGISTANGLTLALLMRALQMIASLPGAVFIPDIIAGRK